MNWTADSVVGEINEVTWGAIGAWSLITALIALAVTAVFIGLIIWGSKFAYDHGKRTGNMTVSIILIAIGVFVGATLIPGIFHLIGTTKTAQQSNPFNGIGKERVKVRCPNCKQLVDETATFCPSCGEKLA